ncbi:MAG: hypothetical protein ACJAT6_000217 [Akkermansiaceae bacterium]|jgi:hypothetical protein
MKKPKSKSEPKVKPETKAELKPSGPKKKAMAGKVTF